MQFKNSIQNKNEDLIILLGGLGSRLRSVVKDVPKPMALINKRPFLYYLLDYWSDIGIQRFHLLTGYKSEIIENYFGNSFKNKQLIYYKESIPLGTGGALKKFIEQIPNNYNNTNIFILNGDTWLEIDQHILFTQVEIEHNKMIIAVRNVEYNDRYTTLKIKEGEIKEINLPNKTEATVNAGLYVIPIYKLKEQLKKITYNKFSFEDLVFPLFLYKNELIASNCIKKFIDIGVPEDYQKAISYLTDNYK